MIVITDERCTGYHAPGHPEKPSRISRTVERLKAQTELKVQWADPAVFEDELLERAHTREHLARLKTADADFDGDTPAHPGIYEHARRGVGGALAALQAARSGQHAFSLLRPPGHHATRNRAMGFCYLSSMAVAALEALASGTRKIAILDFDVHHGNGTEAILLDHPHAVFFSIHQHPCYPGTGTRDAGGNCFNFPVPPRTPREEYRKVLRRALDEVQRASPTLLAVSAGFDAYARDPIAQETLELEDFHWLGEAIRQLSLPTFSILEGGYSGDLPELILAYIKGLEGG